MDETTPMLGVNMQFTKKQKAKHDAKYANSNVEKLGKTYDSALKSMRKNVDSKYRVSNAIPLSLYPDREFILKTVQDAAKQLNVDGIQVQVILNGQQITIVEVPSGVVEVVIKDCDSLCTLSVGADETLWVKDISQSEFLQDHPSFGSEWNAWCAAPIHIYDSAVGTVCALDRESHSWSTSDKEFLTNLANIIGVAVQEWANSTSQKHLRKKRK